MGRRCAVSKVEQCLGRYDTVEEAVGLDSGMEMPIIDERRAHGLPSGNAKGFHFCLDFRNDLPADFPPINRQLPQTAKNIVQIIILIIFLIIEIIL